MTATPRFEKRSSFAEKYARLIVRMRDPEWRRYAKVLFGGKLMGVALVLLMIGVVTVFLGVRVYAADPEVKASDIVNPINTVWTLVAAFLVFGMQVGFTMLEAGFCRSRETVNVLMECIVDTCLCGLLFFALGFAFMFSHGNGFIGYALVLLCRARRPPTRPPASRSSLSGCSSSPSPTPAPPSLPAR